MKYINYAVWFWALFIGVNEASGQGRAFVSIQSKSIEATDSAGVQIWLRSEMDSLKSAFVRLEYNPGDLVVIDAEANDAAPAFIVVRGDEAGLVNIAMAAAEEIVSKGDSVLIGEVTVKSPTPGQYSQATITPIVLQVAEDAPEADAGALGVVTFEPGLPVSLSAFWAHSEGDSVTLAWQTLTEANSSHFEVVRYADADFSQTVVGRIDGQGTKDGLTHYNFVDVLEYPGDYLYYLRQYDFDGWFSTYGPVAASFVQIEDIVIKGPYPNPTNRIIEIDFSVNTSQRAQGCVFDVLGRCVISLDFDYLPAQAPINWKIDLATLPSGHYFITLKGPRFRITKPFILIR